MKRTLNSIAVFLLIVFSIGCEEQFSDLKKLSIFDLRVNSDSALTLSFVDYPTQIVRIDYPRNDNKPVYDTLGYTKVLSKKKLISDYPWPVGYGSPKHLKTNVLFSATKKIEIAFIGAGGFKEDLIIIENGLLIKKIGFPTAAIKKVQISEIDRYLKITSNRSWEKTPKYPDEIAVIDY